MAATAIRQFIIVGKGIESTVFKVLVTRWGSPRLNDLTCSVVHRANEDFKKCALLIPVENPENLKIDDIAEA